VLWANGSIRSTNPASDQARESSFARTSSKSSSLKIFDALLVGVDEKNELVVVAKVKNRFVPRIRNKHFPALKALQIAEGHFRNLPVIQVTQPPA
jgi:hypothetical protein